MWETLYRVIQILISLQEALRSFNRRHYLFVGSKKKTLPVWVRSSKCQYWWKMMIHSSKELCSSFWHSIKVIFTWPHKNILIILPQTQMHVRTRSNIIQIRPGKCWSRRIRYQIHKFQMIGDPILTKYSSFQLPSVPKEFQPSIACPVHIYCYLQKTMYTDKSILQSWYISCFYLLLNH